MYTGYFPATLRVKRSVRFVNRQLCTDNQSCASSDFSHDDSLRVISVELLRDWDGGTDGCERQVAEGDNDHSRLDHVNINVVR